MCGYKIQFARLPASAGPFTLENMYNITKAPKDTIMNLEETGSDKVSIEFVKSFNPTQQQKTAIKDAIQQALLPQVVEVPT